MVGHGVHTAKGGKSGEAISLFLRQNTGNFVPFQADFTNFNALRLVDFRLKNPFRLIQFPKINNRKFF